MPRKSKSEWQVDKQEHEERTDADEQVSAEIKEDADTAQSDWSGQDDPVLSDTADALNAVAEELKADIQQQHGEQAETVDESIETQRQEVSEPARQDESTERTAADQMDVASGRNKRFGKKLSDASDQRRDAEEFLRELAEADEADQEQSKETLDEHRRAVEQAIQSIREF